MVMKTAIDEFGIKTYAINDHYLKTLKFHCEGCGDKMIFCNGGIVKPYFRHDKKEMCQVDWEPETEWHIQIKDLFSYGHEEIIKIGENRKRADVKLKKGLVIEAQHSPINKDEIRAREKFYKNMVWIFDANQAYYDGRISLIRMFFSWKRGRRSILECNKPVFIHIEYDRFLLIEDLTISWYFEEKWHSWRAYSIKGAFVEFSNETLISYLENLDNELIIQTDSEKPILPPQLDLFPPQPYNI